MNDLEVDGVMREVLKHTAVIKYECGICLIERSLGFRCCGWYVDADSVKMWAKSRKLRRERIEQGHIVGEEREWYVRVCALDREWRPKKPISAVEIRDL